jgi:hypothetical protein
VRLTTSAGRALLDQRPVEAVDETFGLPDQLCLALRQWAWSAEQLAQPGAAHPDEQASRRAELSRRGAYLASVVAAVRGERVDYVDPLRGTVRGFGQGRPVPAPRGEPVPWGTGLALLGMVAVLVGAMDLALTAALRAEFRWVWLPANVLVGVGLTPTVLLLRDRRFWRWIGYGIALGLIASWLALAIAAFL